jgi:multiple sugar transport system ATP-binding protein
VSLDAKLRVQMRTTVARLQHQLGTTTVYVTHDQTEAMTPSATAWRSCGPA